MRVTMAAILTVAGLAACRWVDPERYPPPDRREAQIVALSVASDPSGATVKVNKIERTWTTPCDIADYSISRGAVDVEVSLAGYPTWKRKVQWNGSEPVMLDIAFPISETEKPVIVKAVEPPPSPPPPPVAPKAAPQEEKPAVKPEAVPGGTRMRVNAGTSKVRIVAKTVVAEPDKPGEYLLPDVPPERALVEFLDPKTDAVLHSVEFAPPSAPAGKAIPPKDPPIAEADRVGEVKVVSKTYGVFVKLEPGQALQPGEEILIFRDGKEVARTKILKITRGDAAYPDGAAQVQKEGAIQKGDEARRTKP